jgi:hypothetical protein
MSLGKRLGIYAGVLVVILVVAAVGFYLLIDRAMVQAMASSPAPAGWQDSVRIRGHLPDLTGLVLERTVDGDGSALYYDSTTGWRAPAGVAALYDKVVTAGVLTPANLALWQAVATDTALDRIAGLARLRGWAAMSRALPNDTVGAFSIVIPNTNRVRTPMQGLGLRALWRATHRDLAGSRTDLAAVMGIGEQMFRRESPVGNMIGVQVIRDAIRGAVRIAAVTKDSGLARRIEPVSAWLRHKPSSGFAIRSVPADADSRAALAADTTLPLAYRALALETMAVPYLRARAVVFGMPSAFFARIEPFLKDADPDLARYAAAVKREWEAFGALSVRRRYRMFSLIS